MECRADPDGDGYRPAGERYWVSDGTEADWIPLDARTGDGEDPHADALVARTSQNDPYGVGGARPSSEQ